MRYRRKIPFVLILAVLAVSPQATSEEFGWQYREQIIDVQLSAKTDFEYKKIYLFAESEEGASVVLSCSDRFGLSAAIVFEDMTVEQIFETTARRLKGRAVSVSYGTVKPKKANWAYERKTKSLQSIVHWQAARVYNAAATGNTLHLDISRLGKRTLSMPKVDQNFRTFRSNCQKT